jgi:hypothetical protein
MKAAPAAVKATAMKAASAKTASAATIKPAAAIVARTAIETAAVIAFVVIAAVVVIAISAQRAAHYAGDSASDDRARDIVPAELDLLNIRAGLDPLRADQSRHGRSHREDQRNPDGSSTLDQHHPKSFRGRYRMAGILPAAARGRNVVELPPQVHAGRAKEMFSCAFGTLLSAVIGFSLALIGVTAARAIFWTIPTRFLTGVAAAGGLAFINSVATTTGGFFGSYMMGWLKDFSGSYVVGLLAVAAIIFASTLAR